MKPKKIFIGDIKKRIGHNETLFLSDKINVNNESITADYYGYLEKHDIVYKKNAFLIQVKDNYYLYYDNINSFIDFLRIYYGKLGSNKNYSELLMTTCPSSQNPLFVDRDSLKPYFGDVLRYSEEPTPTLKRDLRR